MFERIRSRITFANVIVTAFASVGAQGDGGGNDNFSCHTDIVGIFGAQPVALVPDSATTPFTALPLTQSASLGAGTHTVRVLCARGTLSNVTVLQRALSVVATS